MTEAQREIASDPAHLEMARRIGRRYAAGLPPHLAEDCEAAALAGLCDAASKFDAAAGVRFATYAPRRILGAVVDWVRMSGYPKGCRRRLGRPSAAPRVIAISQTTADEGLASGDQIEDYRGVPRDYYAERLEAWGETRWRRAHLPVRVRVVAYLWLVECLPVWEIGELVGLHSPRVSQLLGEFKRGVSNDPAGGGTCGGGEKQRGGGGVAGGDGGGLRAAGSDTEGGAVVLDTGYGRPGSDPCGVAEGGGAGDEPRRTRVEGPELPDGVGPAGVRGEGGAARGELAGPPPGPVPADLAVTRCTGEFARGGRAVARSLPPPAAASRKAAALREAMFDALGAEDVAAAVRAVADRAKAGDARAAALLFSLLGAMP